MDIYCSIIFLLSTVINIVNSQCGFIIRKSGPYGNCGVVGQISSYHFGFYVYRTGLPTPEPEDTYDVKVSFDWQVTHDDDNEIFYDDDWKDPPSKIIYEKLNFYNSGDPADYYEYNDTHIFNEPGYYIVKHKVEFSNLCGNEPDDKESFTSRSTSLFLIEEDSCDSGVTTLAPTISQSPSKIPTAETSTTSSTSSATTMMTRMAIIMINIIVLTPALLFLAS